MGMPKYDRLLHILNLLRSRRNLNAARLAQECGVTERSIYRDILSLSEANVPIYFDRGYKLASDNFLPPLNFDFEEYTSLKLALESSPLARADRYTNVLKRIRGKVDAGLSQSVRQQRQTAVQTTHIEIPVSQSEQNAQRYYRLIEMAIVDSRCIELHYQSITSGETERRVEPYFIVFRARAFYFVAYCRLRKEFRTFRIDRILGMTLSEERFSPRRDVNPRDYFEGSWEVYSGEPVEVVIEFTGSAARVVQSGRHHLSEVVETLGPDHVRYRVTVNGLEEIKRWILGFGDEARVVSPEELRGELLTIGEYLAATYRPAEGRKP
ncbi:MAG TPA: YafY family protein [Acidobacteriota bacterium]|nr:YafY family protein [Acidobacteriota bacterium]